MLKKLDPITGPVPREQFNEIINAPHGHATKMIRKFDPLYGRNGEKFKWAVRFTREVQEEGYAYVDAATEEEAEKLGRALDPDKLSWDVGDVFVAAQFDSVEPET